MRRAVPGIVGLLYLLGCGGGGDGPTPPDDPLPDISGLWSGTETVERQGGSQCHADIEPGSRAGDMFTVTQDGGQIVIRQLVNCVICQYTGTIDPEGIFQASGTIPPAVMRIEGQVDGDNMTATKRPFGVDCDQVAEYVLTRAAEGELLRINRASRQTLLAPEQ